MSRYSARLIVVAVLVAMLAFLAPVVSRSRDRLAAAVEDVSHALMIAPAAFTMGMPFPSGLARLEKLHPASVRWAWALNAASSVLGSASAIFLAIYLGLRETLLVGGDHVHLRVLNGNTFPVQPSSTGFVQTTEMSA